MSVQTGNLLIHFVLPTYALLYNTQGSYHHQSPGLYHILFIIADMAQRMLQMSSMQNDAEYEEL